MATSTTLILGPLQRGAMPRDIDTYRQFCAWFSQRQRRLRAWNAALQSQKYAPIRRTGPAAKWETHDDQRPGGFK